jgi:hypothetical protein
LRLGNIDNGTGHAANHDHAAWGLARHEMTGDGCGKQIGAVNIDSPQLAHAINGVVDSLKVFGEASRGDEMVDFAMLFDNFGDAALNRFGVRNVGKVSGDGGDALATVRNN